MSEADALPEPSLRYRWIKANVYSALFGVVTGFTAVALSSAFAVNDPETSAVAIAIYAGLMGVLGALGFAEGSFWTTATDLGRQTGGLVAAFMNTGGNALGALSPVLTPWLMDVFGWKAAIGIACAIIALGGVLWLRIEPRPADDAHGSDEEMRG